MPTTVYHKKLHKIALIKQWNKLQKNIDNFVAFDTFTKKVRSGEDPKIAILKKKIPGRKAGTCSEEEQSMSINAIKIPLSKKKYRPFTKLEIDKAQEDMFLAKAWGYYG